MSKDEILEAIKGMSVLELSELVKDLEEQFGVSAAAPVAVAAASPVAQAANGGAPAAADEEQSELSVVLEDFGSSKINVIKAVREVTSLGLREAKELVESAPKAVREGISKDEASEVQKKLQEAGATVALK